MDSWQQLNNVPFICRDADGNGQADVTGCTAWQQNQNSNTCGGIDTAAVDAPSKCRCDNTINIQGLTVCASQQPQCIGTTGVINTSPCEPDFSARVKITTSATATTFPPSSVLYGNLYLDYRSSNQRMALQYFDQSQMPAKFNDSAPTIVREDILYPCLTSNKVTCASGCTTLFNKNWIPRLFVEGNYAVTATQYLPDVQGACTNAPNLGSGAGTLGGDLAADGFVCFKKTLPSTFPPESIAYVWAKQDPTRWILGAASQTDGTIWEFFKRPAATTPQVRGSMLATTMPLNLNPNNGSLYDFTKLDSLCSSDAPSCMADTQVVFVVDEQPSVLLADWQSYWIPYVYQTISHFDPTNTNDQFGFCFASSPNACIPTSLVRLSKCFFFDVFIDIFFVKPFLKLTIIHLQYLPQNRIIMQSTDSTQQEWRCYRFCIIDQTSSHNLLQRTICNTT